MKTHIPLETPNRFNGSLRHYHRTPAHRRTWDDWVDGGAGLAPQTNTRKKLLKLLAYGVGAVLLFSIITGLSVAFF